MQPTRKSWNFGEFSKYKILRAPNFTVLPMKLIDISLTGQNHKKSMGQVKNLRGDNPNEVPAKIEPKPSGIGDTRNLSIAVQDKKINEVGIKEITEVLRLVMMKLGIRGNNLPSQVETMVLLEHISVNYGNHTLAEIKLAFD